MQTLPRRQRRRRPATARAANVAPASSSAPPTPPTPTPTPAPPTPPTPAAKDLAAPLPPAVVAYQQSPADQQQIERQLLSILATTFLARWAELTYGAHGDAPEAARTQIASTATATAHRLVRGHNGGVARVVTQHLQHTPDADAAALHTSVAAWLSGPRRAMLARVAREVTAFATQLADLHAGGPSAVFVLVDDADTPGSGVPQPDAPTCPTCAAFAGRVLTAQDAWAFVALAHPGCTHRVQLITAP